MFLLFVYGLVFVSAHCSNIPLDLAPVYKSVEKQVQSYLHVLQSMPSRADL